MDQKTITELLSRNQRLIDIVTRKIERDCPGAVDLFGIGGSFCSGDYYERSDLDLVIISRNDNAKALEKCFILNDVGFDIYTHDFRSFEEAALYREPFVTKLIDLTIIKTSKYGAALYKELQEKLRVSMNDAALIRESALHHYDEMLRALGRMNGSIDKGEVYGMLAVILMYAEFIVYICNGAYVKNGIKNIPREIAAMSNLPEGFVDSYGRMIALSDIEEIKAESAKLVSSFGSFLGCGLKQLAPEIPEEIKPKKELKPENLIGTYEEIWSNWYNKMRLAAETGDRYLSFVAMVCCQEFYNEMYEAYEILRIELICGYDPNDLHVNVKRFEAAMEEWKRNYDRLGLEICRFETIDEFEKAYLG